MNYTFRKATAILFSRIVLTQLDNEQRSAFRKAEKLTKQYTKKNLILKTTKIKSYYHFKGISNAVLLE